MSSSPSAVLFLGYAVDAEIRASVVYDREKKKFLKRSDVDVDDDDDDDDVVDDWDNLFDGYCDSMKSLDPSWEKTFSVCNLRYEDDVHINYCYLEASLESSSECEPVLLKAGSRRFSPLKIHSKEELEDIEKGKSGMEKFLIFLGIDPSKLRFGWYLGSEYS